MLSDARHLIADLPIGVCVCEAPGGAIRLYNRRAVELWGREPALGDADERYCGSWRLYHLDGTPLDPAHSPMAEVLRGAGACRGELIMERPDGSRLTAAIHVTPLLDAEGRVEGAVSAFDDITSRRAAEDALRVSEARYRVIVEDQPELVCRFRADGAVTFANQAYRAYFGIEGAPGESSSYQPTVHPDDLSRVQAQVASLSPANPVVTIENRVFRADGQVRWAVWTNHAVFDGQGRILEFQATGRDVTERRRTEEDLKASVQTLEALYRLANLIGRARGRQAVCDAGLQAIVSVARADRASVLLADASGVMRFASWVGLSDAYRAAVEGHSPWAADEKDPQVVVVEDLLASQGLGALREVVAAEGIRSLAFVPLVAQGRLLGKFMLYHDAPHAFTPEELRLAATVAHHVSFGLTRVDSEEAIAELLERERGARREADAARGEAVRAIQAKDEFLAMLAHELRNPLGVIVNAIALIDDSATLEPELRRPSAMIRRQAGHLARLLDDLLDVARITSGRIELERAVVDLPAAVGLAVEAQRPFLDAKRQRLTVTLPPREATVLGDPVRIQQVLGNLVNNASKYTPGGGTIAVSLEASEGEAVLRVRDDGSGIPQDKLDAIFELFSQANPTLARTEGGLGIGLTLVRKVVELHGGTVGARSDGPGLGAEFTVRLPLAPAVPAPSRAGKARPQATPRRVLVIEDHEDGREVLAVSLQQYGHQVDQAASGREGIEAAQRARPDVALVDIGLPDLDGYEVARELRRLHGRGVQVIALTGYGQPQDRIRALEAGFDAHLVKPVEPARLVALLEELAREAR